VEVNLKSVQVC